MGFLKAALSGRFSWDAPARATRCSLPRVRRARTSLSSISCSCPALRPLRCRPRRNVRLPRLGRTTPWQTRTSASSSTSRPHRPHRRRRPLVPTTARATSRPTPARSRSSSQTRRRARTRRRCRSTAVISATSATGWMAPSRAAGKAVSALSSLRRPLVLLELKLQLELAAYRPSYFFASGAGCRLVRRRMVSDWRADIMIAR